LEIQNLYFGLWGKLSYCRRNPIEPPIPRYEQIESAMNSLVRFLVIILLLLVAVGGGLIYLGQAGSAPVQSVEKVLPDDQFPR
tara:strand:+ start:2982 stop:3230 length:249 start_codon:yes stop_codon:yes gene_type:complete